MGFKYHAKITEQQLPQMDTGTVPAILRDLSVSNDADKPITAGLFKLQAGKSLKYTYTYTYTYTYEEMKLRTEGTFIIKDGIGQKESMALSRPINIIHF